MSKSPAMALNLEVSREIFWYLLLPHVWIRKARSALLHISGGGHDIPGRALLCFGVWKKTGVIDRTKLQDCLLYAVSDVRNEHFRYGQPVLDHPPLQGK